MPAVYKYTPDTIHFGCFILLPEVLRRNCGECRKGHIGDIILFIVVSLINICVRLHSNTYIYV